MLYWPEISQRPIPLTDLVAKPAVTEEIDEEIATVIDETQTDTAVPQSAHPSLSEVSKTICGKEKRIREAIERHRQARASPHQRPDE